MTKWDEYARHLGLTPLILVVVPEGDDTVPYSAEDNPCDSLLRQLTGKPKPARNDCGYPSRFECEDTARMFGWGVEGEGPCDYPQTCPWYREGKCPFEKG